MRDATPVWLDTDIALGLDYFPGIHRDIDDALAMIALCNSPLVELRGVSATFANTTTRNAWKIASDLMARFGPAGTPVHMGAEKPMPVDGLGDLPQSDATWAMAQALREKPMHILALGAATNVAVLIASHPELVDRILSITAMGGRSHPGEAFLVGPRQLKPFKDLNFEADVEAWRIILASNVPLTLAPFSLAHSVWFTEEDVQSLKEDSEACGQHLVPYMHRWAREWRELYGAPGFNPFDCLAAGYLIVPEMFQKVAAPLGIVEPGQQGNDRDVPCLVASEEMGRCRRVDYLTAVNACFRPHFLDMLRGGMRMSLRVLAVSHINIIVDDIDKATEFYQRTLGFVVAANADGPMDYRRYTDPAFARDAGFPDGQVDVDVRFLRHPQAGVHLELMRYHAPRGDQTIPFRKTNDLGGPRHIALEVTDINAILQHLHNQPDIPWISRDPATGGPENVGDTDIAFFYWMDPHGVQWEMEQGRPLGMGREIAG